MMTKSQLFYNIITRLMLLTTLAELALATTTITCEFDRILSVYSCNPISAKPPLTHDNEDIIVNGSHLVGFKDDDIAYIRFNSPLTFRYVPTKLFEVFRNIETFGLQSVNLTKLTTAAFTNCYKMKSLHIDGNAMLTVIPAGFAEDCANLQNLYMSGNGIEFIDKSAFKGLENLRYLVLTKNAIEELHADTFNDVVNLQYLFIDHNHLKYIHDDLFHPLRKLQLTSLTHNDVEEISVEMFRNNALLDSLFLDHNAIVAIDGKFFEKFPGSRDKYEIRFYANNCTNAIISNQIDDHGDDDFEMCIAKWNDTHPSTTMSSNDEEKFSADNHNESHVEISSTTATTAMMTVTPSINIHQRDCRYFLNENRKYTCVLERVDLVLTAINGAHYENLNDLDVTQVFFYDSLLSKVPSIVFAKFPNLEFISVASCHLTIINDQTFDECGDKLKTIDASNNFIAQIVETSLRNCKALMTIDVSGNPIEFIDGEIFSYDPQLRHIILHKKF